MIYELVKLVAIFMLMCFLAWHDSNANISLEKQTNKKNNYLKV